MKGIASWTIFMIVTFILVVTISTQQQVEFTTVCASIMIIQQLLLTIMSSSYLDSIERIHKGILLDF